LGREAVEAEQNAEKEMMDNAGKKRKDGAGDEIQTAVPGHKNERTLLVLLQFSLKRPFISTRQHGVTSHKK